MLKAIHGGGGRGMRIVRESGELEELFERAQSEAQQAFGKEGLYVERLVDQARHIEVQIAGDSSGEVVHFGNRDCTLQRRHQKLIEIAPAPDLDSEMAEQLNQAALKIAKAANYQISEQISRCCICRLEAPKTSKVGSVTYSRKI